MGNTPDYREVMGLGAPLLSVRVGDSEVTLHRKESAGLARSADRIGSLGFRVVGPGNEIGGGGMVGHPWGGTIVGDRRVICGELPPRAASAEATVGGEPVPAQVGSGVWLIAGPRDQKVIVAFRDAAGKSVKRLRIRPWPAPPDRAEMMRRQRWIEAPDYVPRPPGERRRAGDWGDWIERYGLGEPLVTVPLRDRQAALYRQRHTGRIWQAITGIGGSCGPIDAYFGWGARQIGGEQILHGTLPPNVSAAEATTSAGERVPVHLVPGAFIAVAPSAQDVKATLRNGRGRAVWSHHFKAGGRQPPPTPSEVIRIYWMGLRVLAWRLRYGPEFWRR
ncbi:MAG: hypothetical protein M3Q65_04285 [Chloroflexota bacterium]|nr:hypothetical protein [Chloroflexota bacterium]